MVCPCPGWDAAAPSGFAEQFTQLSKEPVKFVDVVFKSDTSTVLAAPVTEIVTATVKPDQDLELFAVDTTKGLTTMEGAEGFLGAVWGFVSHDPRQIVIMTGWTTKEVSFSCAVYVWVVECSVD